MTPAKTIIGRLRKTRWFPVLAGAIVGLVTGAAGMAADPQDGFVWLGGMLGAVCGGITAAALSNHGIRGDTINAGIADVVSSALFFAIVVVALLTDTNDLVAAALFAPYMLLFGSALAVPIAFVSLGIAVLSGLAASLAKRAVSRVVTA